MTLAELLRRSAEYARRSVEELARALNPPARHGAPSFEPSYAPRNRPFRPRPFGKRGFHWSSHCESRRARHPHRFFGRAGHRGSKFFRSNFNSRPHCHHRLFHRLFCGALKATKLTLCMALRRPECTAHNVRSSSLVMPNLMLRAGVSRLQLRPRQGDIWQLRLSLLYGNQLTPGSSPYEQMKQSFTPVGLNKCDSALLRYQDQFRSKHTFAAEIREKLRGLAAYQQSIASFLFPKVSESPEPPEDHFEAEVQDVREPTAISAAVDFSLAPRLNLPVVGELDENMVDSIRSAIQGQIANLQAILADVDRISELGELPVSVEHNGTVLRVHLPNCDAERANVLVDDKEVTRGRTVEIVAPRISVPGTDELSSSSSSLFEVGSDVSSETADEVWDYVRNGTPELTTRASSPSHSSPSLLTLN